MSDSCTVFSFILSPPGPLNGWQPMVTPADWEVQIETKLTSSFPESPFRNKCVWLNISTWPTTDDIELWEWPKKTWRGNCIAKKIKSESRLSSVPASFAESCPKFQSATPSHWNLWHALCRSTWAFPWKLSETMQLELARAININLLTSPIFPDTMSGFNGSVPQKRNRTPLTRSNGKKLLTSTASQEAYLMQICFWCLPTFHWSRPGREHISPLHTEGRQRQCTIESGGLKSHWEISGSKLGITKISHKCIFVGRRRTFPKLTWNWKWSSSGNCSTWGQNFTWSFPPLQGCTCRNAPFCLGRGQLWSFVLVAYTCTFGAARTRSMQQDSVTDLFGRACYLHPRTPEPNSFWTW